MVGDCLDTLSASAWAGSIGSRADSWLLLRARPVISADRCAGPGRLGGPELVLGLLIVLELAELDGLARYHPPDMDLR